MGETSSAGRYRVAEALWRTVARAGLAGVSVRTVATEAGVTGGTVQHYFRTRAEMIRFAMELIAERVEQRLQAIPRRGAARQWTRSILLELLPISPGRREEFGVWLAFTAHADTDPVLVDVKHETAGRLARLYRGIVAARGAGAGPAEEDRAHGAVPSRSVPSAAETETVLLQAVVDGLSLHLASMDLPEAEAMGPYLLDRYLEAMDTRIRSH